MISFKHNYDDDSKYDVIKLRKIGNEILTVWSEEYIYFQSLSGCPEHDHEQYQEMLSHSDQRAQILRDYVTLHSNPDRNKATEEQIKRAIKEFEEVYIKITDYVKQHSTIGRLEASFLHRIDELKRSISEDIHLMMDGTTEVITNKISDGIKDLIGLKSELGLAKEFGDKIKKELSVSSRKERFFMWSLIGTILAIPLLNGIVNWLVPGGLDAIRYMLFGSITASLLFISIFLYAQYRTYMMLRLRYTHLDGFLGGGATFLSQLLESDNPDFKLEVNKKLAELFMSLDDVLTMVNKNKHPTEMTLDTAVKIFDKVNTIKK